MLPLMVAPAIAALMWKLMTNANFGMLSYFVSLLGFHDFKWASAPQSAMFTVVLVDIWVYTPFITILLLAGLRGLPRQPFEAAELDGVPGSFVFFRIMLPMLLPYILTAGLFRMLDSIQQFDIIYAMTQGGPGDTLMVFQVQAYTQAFIFTNIGRASAMLMVLWADHLRAEQRLREELAAPARARPRRRLREDASMTVKSILRAVALTVIGLFFLFPMFWVVLMSFMTQRRHPAQPAEPVLHARRCTTTSRWSPASCTPTSARRRSTICSTSSTARC